MPKASKRATKQAPARTQSPADPHECSVPLHWLHKDNAPRFSRLVARRSAAVENAMNALRAALEEAYPVGALVEVFHSRGNVAHRFSGFVTGWDARGARVVVCNEKTGKTAKWWAAQVQLPPIL